ncbi:hypothetical protein D910_06608 [Dendroctonus ponderosae]
MKIPKPQMHGLAQSRITKWLISSLINAALGGLAFQIFYIDHKKKIYNDFYANYDIDKEFETMRAKGLFDSC